VLNLKLGCHLLGASAIDIGHGHQLGFGNQAAQILRVPLAHLPDSQNSYAQFAHFFAPG
jgi:hypothetical protein